MNTYFSVHRFGDDERSAVQLSFDAEFWQSNRLKKKQKILQYTAQKIEIK